ncbi:MAG: hypothetical protein ABJE95_11225 [Byssovorax sp.]
MSPKDHVAVRLDNPTLERVDALKDVLSTAWHEATRSDILRALILTGLEHLEAEHRGALSKPKKGSAEPASGAAKPKAKKKTAPKG